MAHMVATIPKEIVPAACFQSSLSLLTPIMLRRLSGMRFLGQDHA
jgi:hypothetical protein